MKRIYILDDFKVGDKIIFQSKEGIVDSILDNTTIRIKIKIKIECIKTPFFRSKLHKFFNWISYNVKYNDIFLTTDVSVWSISLKQNKISLK